MVVCKSCDPMRMPSVLQEMYANLDKTMAILALAHT